jgi:hypothetical protein
MRRWFESNRRRRSLARRLKDTLGLYEMRAVDHLSIETHDSNTRSRRESGDDPLRPGDFGCRGHECGVDRVDLVGMYGELAGETIPARAIELARESILVTKINMHRVDGLYCESRGRK